MIEPTRRRIVLRGLGLAGLAALAPKLRTANAAAAAQEAHLDVKDPAAIVQKYVENVSQIDPKKTPEFVPGSSCENCLQLQGSPGNDYRPCSLFPGKLVSVSGWCKGWTAEM